MSSTTRPRTLPWSLRALGLGGAVVAGTLAVALFLGQGGGGPGVVPGSAIGTGSAACIEPYSPVAISHRTFAFEGTVVAIDGERVTFDVGSAWRGVEGSTVTLEAPGMTGTAITSAGGPNLVVGQRYLVAGDDRFVWGCGYTQPYDPAIAADWAAALGG